MILVVEDSPEDYAMIRRAIERSGLQAEVCRCHDGDEALDFLHGHGGSGVGRTPSLVLLDLNLPGTDGREVLAEVRDDAALAAIPFVVLSNSNNQQDIDACYALGANSFIEKPVGPEAFTDMMRTLGSYWLGLVALPRGARATHE